MSLRINTHAKRLIVEQIASVLELLKDTLVENDNLAQEVEHLLTLAVRYFVQKEIVLLNQTGYQVNGIEADCIKATYASYLQTILNELLSTRQLTKVEVVQSKNVLRNAGSYRLNRASPQFFVRSEYMAAPLKKTDINYIICLTRINKTPFNRENASFQQIPELKDPPELKLVGVSMQIALSAFCVSMLGLSIFPHALTLIISAALVAAILIAGLAFTALWSIVNRWPVKPLLDSARQDLDDAGRHAISRISGEEQREQVGRSTLSEKLDHIFEESGPVFVRKDFERHNQLAVADVALF